MPWAEAFFLNTVTGEITYTPKQDFNGNDTFTYTVRDDGTTDGDFDPKTATATVTVTVTPVNDVPVAVTDQQTTPEDNSLFLGASLLLANDLQGPADPTVDREETQTLMITDVSQRSREGGTVTLIGSTLTYTPPTDYNGLDTFTYTIVDNGTNRWCIGSKRRDRDCFSHGVRSQRSRPAYAARSPRCLKTVFGF